MAASVSPASVMRVRGQIRELLLHGELTPGEPVRQAALAERFGVSRAPIREALRMLESEGVVVNVPNAGYSVTRLTKSELEQVYRLRALLEDDLARAMPKVKPSVIRELRSLNKRMTKLLAAGDISAGSLVNREFHLLIFEQAGLDLICKYVEMAWTRSAPYHALVLYAAEQGPRVAHDHEEIIAALEDGDNERLVALMDHHRNVGRDRVLETLDLLQRHGANLMGS